MTASCRHVGSDPSGQMSEIEIVSIGMAIYTAAVRGASAKSKIKMAFAKLVHVPGRSLPKIEMAQRSEAPFILTPRVRELWKLLVSAVKDGQLPEPVLLYGPPGDEHLRALCLSTCNFGKSCASHENMHLHRQVPSITYLTKSCRFR